MSAPKCQRKLERLQPQGAVTSPQGGWAIKEATLMLARQRTLALHSRNRSKLGGAGRRLNRCSAGCSQFAGSPAWHVRHGLAWHCHDCAWV